MGLEHRTKSTAATMIARNGRVQNEVNVKKRKNMIAAGGLNTKPIYFKGCQNSAKLVVLANQNNANRKLIRLVLFF